MSRRNISPSRKVAFYLGNAISGFGFLLFFSAPLAMFGVTGFGVPTSFESLLIRPFAGILLIGGGQVLSSIGKKGLAGAGLILDPEQERTDIEPWSRMGGGMIKDALDEADIHLGGKAAELPFDEQLRRLHQLREDGIISETEYLAKKKQIIESA